MFGLLGLKSSGVGSAALQTVALLPLPLLTLAQWISVTDLFATPLHVLSLKAAAELDRRDKVLILEKKSKKRRRMGFLCCRCRCPCR